MDRITDHLLRLAQRVAESRWVTIGAKAGKKTNGKKKGGVPVLLDDDGKIVKGPAKLTGKKLNELKKAAPAAKGQSGPAAAPKDDAKKPFLKAFRPEADKPTTKRPQSLAPSASSSAPAGDLDSIDSYYNVPATTQSKTNSQPPAKAGDLGASKHGLVGKLLGSPDGPGDSYSDFRIPGSNMASLAREIGEDKVKAIANYFRDQYQNGPQAKEWKQIEDGTHPRVSKEDYPTREDFDDADMEYHNAYIDKKADRHKREDLEKTPSVAAAQHWLSQYLENNPDASGLKSANDALQEIISGRQREDGPAAPPKIDPKIDPKTDPAPPPAPGTNLFGTPEPTKPQPATTQGLFGEQVPVEDKKTQPKPTATDDAAKGLDWLDQKQDKKTDGTGEMFGGLFSPGQQKTSEPEKPATAARASTLTDLALQKAGVAQNTDDAGLKQAGPVAPPKVGKQPHEMTRAEFAAQGPTDRARQYLADSGMHRGKVQAALDAGQNVPAEVLAEYPGIKKTELRQGPTAKEITDKIQAETDARRAQAKQDAAKARVRDVEDYQQARQAAIDAGQDVNDGDEKQMRRMIRQNEKDRARALQTIANNGPDAEAQAYADRLGKENERLKAKLAKSAGPVAPPKVAPAQPAGPKYVPLSKIDHPAQAAMGTYQKAKATAQERIDRVRRSPRWNDGSMGRPADLQLEMMQAKSALNNANRGIEGAKATLERVANEQGLTTKRPAAKPKGSEPSGQPRFIVVEPSRGKSKWEISGATDDVQNHKGGLGTAYFDTKTGQYVAKGKKGPVKTKQPQGYPSSVSAMADAALNGSNHQKTWAEIKKSLADEHEGLAPQEVASSERLFQSMHRKNIAAALALGADVPEEVLADYPDLAKQYRKAQSATESARIRALLREAI